MKFPAVPNNLSINRNTNEKKQNFSLKIFEKKIIQNFLYKKNKSIYNKKYINDQAASDTFKKHMQEVYSIIKNKFKKESKLVEIGCGQGQFLEIVKQDKFFNYSGYDKVYKGKDKKIFSKYLNNNNKLDADVIVLRHVLEHIPSPHSFLKKLKYIFPKKSLIFIEVPRFEWIEKNKVLFDFTYEHVNYFYLNGIKYFFNKIIECGVFFNGQYMYCLAELNSLNENKCSKLENNKLWKKYSLKKYIDKFCKNIKKMNLDKKKQIWIWGAGTKGVMFLHHLSVQFPKIFKKVNGVVDINILKKNLYIPSTGIKIYSPQNFIKKIENNSSAVIIMNNNYYSEIKKTFNSNLPCFKNIQFLKS